MKHATGRPKRRLPRFSLIALLVAVNVAGVLVWANVKEKTGPIPVSGGRAYETMRYGWPMVACVTTRVTPAFSAVRGESLSESRAWEPAGMLTNGVTALLAVLFFGWVTEFLVRKFHKAKRHDG